MAWASGLGAITFAAVGIAAAAALIAIGLLHEVIRHRKLRRELHAALVAAQAEAEAQQSAVNAVKHALSLAGMYYLRLDPIGTVLDRNAALADLEYSEGVAIDTFDMVAVGVLQQKGRKLRKCRIERLVGKKRIAWSLVPDKGRNGIIEAIGHDMEGEGDATAKATFLATVSHEMRTPLNGVIGMASLLQATSLSAEQQSYVAAIETSGEALLSLINEILDFSRIEAGKLELVSEAVRIEPLVEGVVELLAPKAQDKGIEIAAFVHPDVPATLLSDGARLRQVVMNLASNAVKFTHRGGIGLRVDVRDGEVLLTVSDTGEGIPADRQDAIFREFEQADSSIGRTHGGTGLGLAISRQIVERLGGSISVMSREDAGSVFTVKLPLTSQEPQSPAALPNLSGERVMLVSTSPFATPFLGERLMAAGANVDLVTHVDHALTRLAGITSLVVDAGIGFDAARRIAAAARAAGILRRLILLSPFERRSVGTPVEIGYTGYLIKPVRARSLFARFGASAEPRAVTQDRQETIGLGLAGQRVLVAEDNEINALIVRRMIERMGGVAETVSSGKAALAALQRQERPFALALFDVRMPGMTGIEAIEIWRREEIAEERPRLPIAALTANASESDRQQCLAAGFDGFLAKPLDLTSFERLVATLLYEPRAAA